MSWEWVAPTVTGAVGVASVAAAAWTAGRSRHAQEEQLRAVHRVEDRRAALALFAEYLRVSDDALVQAANAKRDGSTAGEMRRALAHSHSLSSQLRLLFPTVAGPTFAYTHAVWEESTRETNTDRIRARAKLLDEVIGAMQLELSKFQ
jgi:hypothetical protein